jgi:NADH-quinone oxidoreductase subunit L
MEASLLPAIYGIAVLLPLLSFFVILIGAKWLGDKAAWVAAGAIGGAGLLSFLVMFGYWLPNHFPDPPGVHGHHHEGEAHPHDAHPEKAKPDEQHSRSATELPLTLVAHQPVESTAEPPAEVAESASSESESPTPHEERPEPPFTGEYYTLGVFGPLRVTISYYIDSLTVCMFCMVTLIATLIHIYAIGYMHDELHPVTDKEVTLANGEVLHRPGRYPRFFQYLSLFCFSMLGLVLAGNIAMVFVFWELVGICSYFLIGFYVERKSASNAANKAFIVNRVGDFGMIIGLMAIWSSLGTFAFGDIERTDASGNAVVERGIFSQVRPAPSHALIVPAGMVAAGVPAKDQHLVAGLYADHPSSDVGRQGSESEIAARYAGKGWGYWLLVVAGIGIFCGCVGKSAQFPLHVWLPDAMEGPTPVSALVHSATMVAAGVYLVGRFYPVFTPEVLLVIAVIGTITMLLAASIAFAANDIKRVLAYSTVSQLGLMMLALGVGGWAAGMMHLITHAFFKSLLFMCSGSVIHAVHTNDMRKMGGLFNKMPVTAITMLIGCLAIAGVAVPFVVGFSGHYSKDAILEQALSFWKANEATPYAGVFFVLAVLGAAMTTCYMFRMWFMTFVGQPRDQHAYDHAHESPPVMYLPLVILAILAISVAWNIALLGYGLIAAAFFIILGVQQGWFNRPAAAHGHGHDDHGHGHDDHGPAHGHAAPAHSHAAHDHHAHAPAEPPFTWGWLTLMLVGTICVGGLFHFVVAQSLPKDSWIYGLSLAQLLDQSRPLGLDANQTGRWVAWTWPDEHFAHRPEQFGTIVVPATLMASASWAIGILLAGAFYWWGWLSADDVRRQAAPLYNLLVNKWWFDELYDFAFVRPTHVIARLFAWIDRGWIDWFLDGLAASTVWFARRWEYVADQSLVDGSVNLLAGWTYSLGLSLRSIQTGRIRQYVMFIVIGAITIFVLISFFWSPTLPAASKAATSGRGSAPTEHHEK